MADMRPTTTAEVWTRDLLLVGGGHSHIEVLRRFAMRPLAGWRTTLVARDIHTPYSGMLPGYVAGHYSYDECHIDLAALARFAGARFIHAEVAGLDAGRRRLLTGDHPPLRYDLVSFNTGSTPSLGALEGDLQRLIRVKPIDAFLERWQALLARAGAEPFELAVVGGGAGGVELALNADCRLRRVRTAQGLDPSAVRVSLYTDQAEILPAHNKGARARLSRILAERGIRVVTGCSVVRIDRHSLYDAGGRGYPADEVFWVTHAAAPAWLAGAGVATDEHGFLAVNAGLQSLSHPEIFAAGDVASSARHPRPKSGVFAVRQGPYLAAALRRAAAGREPRPYRPQRRFLSLIGTGDRRAVASRGRLAVEGAWVWRLKDWIDRRFMRRYQDLPEMAPPEPEQRGDAESLAHSGMRCAGCGAKVDGAALRRVIDRLIADGDPALAGLRRVEDAAVLTVNRPVRQVHSVDYFRAFTDDEYLFGRITANHCLNDIYATAGRPVGALAIATVPYAHSRIVEERLYWMMRGAAEVFAAAGVRLLGGHSSEGAELALGFSIVGEVEDALDKGGLEAGQSLVLTKPLGTGVLMAASMRGKLPGRMTSAVLQCMSLSNAGAVPCLRAHGAAACTDVTGFGLLGHLLEMLANSAGVGAALQLSRLPALDGAVAALAGGIRSSMAPANRRLCAAALNGVPSDDPRYALLFDPQTAGGLLAAVPDQRAPRCVDALRAAGYHQASIVGRTCERPAGGADAPVEIQAG